jgi:hypothetical protein
MIMCLRPAGDMYCHPPYIKSRVPKMLDGVILPWFLLGALRRNYVKAEIKRT